MQAERDNEAVVQSILCLRLCKLPKAELPKATNRLVLSKYSVLVHWKIEGLKQETEDCLLIVNEPL